MRRATEEGPIAARLSICTCIRMSRKISHQQEDPFLPDDGGTSRKHLGRGREERPAKHLQQWMLSRLVRLLTTSTRVSGNLSAPYLLISNPT